jgi:nitronate monooxygenase
VTLRTIFTEAMSIEHPIVLAPMGGTSGGALAAAVSNAGGLGLVGLGMGYRERVERELPIVVEGTQRPWGVGFITWSVDPETVSRALEFDPSAVMLSFGDPTPLARLVHDAGIPLIVQVTSLGEAERARDVGATYVVAQGTEAGGHGGGRGTLPFVPAVVDLVAPIPVLAAGGIADGRGLAAALVLGAAGALIGTRFVASVEANVTSAEVSAVLKGNGDNTDRSRVIDVAIGAPWPAPYTIRSLRNDYLDRWSGREDALDADVAAKTDFNDALTRGDRTVVPVAAGEAVDLITERSSAADLVATIALDAEEALARVAID